MIGPRRVLELGTFSGYSALCLAEGLQDDDCHVDTIEDNDEQEDFIWMGFFVSWETSIGVLTTPFCVLHDCMPVSNATAAKAARRCRVIFINLIFFIVFGYVMI